MALGDRAHSRLVAWLKILLPLAALALLSTLFMLARPPTQPGQAPFGQDGLRSGTAEEVVRQPVYTGRTAEGAALSVRAAEVRPGGVDGPVTATTVAAELQTSGGGWLRLEAGRAEWTEENGALVFGGGVEMESSAGYALTTARMVVTLDRYAADTGGAVEGRAPAGTIRADRLQVQAAEIPGQARLLFTGRVKLVYEPQG
ncbi:MULTISPECIES: hypothetical protein [unclassified Rhodosalinus]|uniref:hypothetical protein n=1 Tax=unclassified Rhodosalinus TaxID=2630183 RepID=UPI00352660BA